MNATKILPDIFRPKILVCFQIRVIFRFHIHPADRIGSRAYSKKMYSVYKFSILIIKLYSDADPKKHNYEISYVRVEFGGASFYIIIFFLYNM